MSLIHLATIVEGLDSLAEIEKEHPALGKQLLAFVEEIRDCCDLAYGRLSDALRAVQMLPPKPTPNELTPVVQQLIQAPNSRWFKDVAGVCNRLYVLAEKFRKPIGEQIEYTSPFGANWAQASKNMSAPRFSAHYKITPMFTLLERQERDLKEDSHNIVNALIGMMSAGGGAVAVRKAKGYATKVQGEISANIDRIRHQVLGIQGSSSRGADDILTPRRNRQNSKTGKQTGARLVMRAPENSIFVCYRRADSKDIVGRIYDHLKAAFGEKAVFRDVERMPVGVQFSKHIAKCLSSCRVGLVIIGPNWLRKNREGVVRLWELDDQVRIECEVILHSNRIARIPCLVGDATMPARSLLPRSLKELPTHHGATVRSEKDFPNDIRSLIDEIRKALSRSRKAKARGVEGK